MTDRWKDRWEVCDISSARRGGQATVQHVVSRHDGRKGALKLLHDDKQFHTERRFRMQQEASALSALTFGVPKLLDTNVRDAGEEEVLFLVMEWIHGPTLGERISEQRMTLDDALTCATQLLRTLEAMHALPIIHRDLKPDNVILQGGAPDRPVIVDLGLAWAEVRPTDSFETEHGQEIGNRFLRLPEFSPGRISRDARSDVALAAGLLLYTITGIAPRVLRDEQGRAPHEAQADQFAEPIVNDERWPRLSRVFTRAFQSDLALRFESTGQLAAALANLRPTAPKQDVMSPALEKLRAHMETERWRRHQALREAVANLGGRFDQYLRQLLQSSSLSLPGGHGFDNAAHAYDHNIGLQVPGVSGGTICSLHHGIVIDGAELVASYGVHGGRPDALYYHGSVVDLVSLEEAMWATAPEMVAIALDTFRELLAE